MCNMPEDALCSKSLSSSGSECNTIEYAYEGPLAEEAALGAGADAPKLPAEGLGGSTRVMSEEELREEARADYNLALMYAQGVGPVQQDKAEALKLYEKACAKGHVKAAYNLGLLYQRGDGVQKDSAKAAEFYQKAHAQGYSKATYNLAMMYQRGVGVEQDAEKAAALMEMAAAEQTDKTTRPKKGSRVPVWVAQGDEKHATKA